MENISEIPHVAPGLSRRCSSGACLDRAIESNAGGFECHGCPDECTEGSLDDDDPMGYTLLWIAILDPDLYKEMVRLRRVEGIPRIDHVGNGDQGQGGAEMRATVERGQAERAN